MPRGEERSARSPAELPGREAAPGGRFLEACALRNAGPPPVWILRQAGRYLPEYREIRARRSFVEMCTNPEIATEVSLLPWRRYRFDAVVVFYDILFLAEAMGAPLRFEEGGPRFLRPVRTKADLRALRAPDVRALDPAEGTGAVSETIRRLRAELPGEVAVVGFAGAPFTLASYLVGEEVRTVLYRDPEFLLDLLSLLAEASAEHLRAQIEAGADAVQLFDSSAGALGREDYRRFALPFARRVFDALRPSGRPAILYVNGSHHLLEDMASSGASVLSVDWRADLAEARRRLGPGIALQGNLDPAALFQPPEGVRRSVRAVAESLRGDPGYIFNLGGGILPDTPPESVAALVEEVRGAASARRG